MTVTDLRRVTIGGSDAASACGFVVDDGGRRAAGFRGSAGDCVTRAIAIASGLPYREIYDRLHADTLSDRATMARLELRYGRHARRHASPRAGGWPKIYKRVLTELDAEWTPTMGIGTGCRVHLRADELPAGRLVVSLSRHLTAVLDGVIHDTYDPSRDGTRCVYGYWRLP